MANRTRSTILRESLAPAPVEVLAEASGGHTGLLTALWLPPEAASALAIEGGEAAEDLHVTLCYSGSVDGLGEVVVARAIVTAENMARYCPPIVGRVSGVGRFQADSGSKDVVYASVDAPGLADFRTHLAEQLRASGAAPSGEHGYTPHITLAYVEPGAPMPVESVEPLTIRFTAITVAVGGQRITIPFSGPDTYCESDQPASAEPGVTPAASVDLAEADGQILGILEAKGPKGNAWDVLLIKAGTSGNARHYPASVLESAVPLFEGARAYADHPTRDEQRNRPERSIRDVVGWFEGVRWDADQQGIRGTFKILESADWLRSALKSAWDQGKKDLLGFSINAMGRVGAKRADNSVLIEAIEKVVSTDVVTTPGAGGRLLGVLESERSAGTGPEGEMDPEEIKRLIQEALASSVSTMQTGLLDAVRSEITTQVAALKPAAGGEGSVVTEAAQPPDPIQEALREIREAQANLAREKRVAEIGNKVDAAKLPAAHALRIKTRLLEAVARRAVDDAEVDSEIAYARELIAESGVARPSWGGMTVQAGDSHHDKMVKALQGWFRSTDVDGVPAVRDLRESYALWQGQSYLDVDPFGLFRSFCSRYDSGLDGKAIRESLGTSDWGQVFADVFYLQMVQAYKANPDYDKWRQFCSDIESVPDFRTRHWARVGGYGDFPSVAEKGTYLPQTSPGDEEITYTLGKYGGLDDVTLEMILGDRVNQIRRMPTLMAQAAIRTLYKFVMDLITTGNPTMDYDTTALYHNNHGNTGTTALSVAGLDAVVVAMRSQTAFGQSQEILGTRNKPRYLIVPNELESRAMRVVDPSEAYTFALSSTPDADTSMDPQRFKGSGIGVHVYDQLTDATDWWAVADPAMTPTMVMGFLNGRQEPELFTQDMPNVGSVFTADKISYKLRFIFGGDILDHRAFYRQVVTGS